MMSLANRAGRTPVWEPRNATRAPERRGGYPLKAWPAYSICGVVTAKGRCISQRITGGHCCSRHACACCDRAKASAAAAACDDCTARVAPESLYDAPREEELQSGSPGFRCDGRQPKPTVPEPKPGKDGSCVPIAKLQLKASLAQVYDNLAGDGTLLPEPQQLDALDATTPLSTPPAIQASIEPPAATTFAERPAVARAVVRKANGKMKTRKAKGGEEARARKRALDRAACDAYVWILDSQSPTDRLIEAAKAEDVPRARAALDEGANPNRPTQQSRSALMWAADKGDVAMATLLLDRSADPNQATTGNGATALMTAADTRHVEVARLLLDRSADPNQVMPDDGHTALMVAACHTASEGGLEMTRLLLDRSADPNQAKTSNGFTALMSAAHYGCLDTVQLLLLFGADPVAATHGLTAGSMASRLGHRSTADCLDAVRGWPAFKIATACRLHTDTRTMLQRGAIDTAGCPLSEIAAVAAASANTLWPGSPAPCLASTALARAAMSQWSPGRHFIYHPGVRSGIHTVLLTAERLRRQHALAVTTTMPQDQMLARTSVFVGLPNEMWWAVFSFFRRADWPVQPASRCPART